MINGLYYLYYDKNKHSTVCAIKIVAGNETEIVHFLRQLN